VSSLPARLLHHARERPGAVALREKWRGRWRELTWGEYARRTAHVGLGLVELGVRPGEHVAIHSANRPEWLLADLGAQGAGAIGVGVYPTSPAAEVAYLLAHSEAVVLIAEDEEQLDKALAVRERLPRLRRIVVIDTRNVQALDDPTVMTFEELERLGEAAGGVEAWAARVDALDPASTAIVVYTSGTTGPPKGAMITHANLCWAAQRFQEAFESTPDTEVLSYLPLCHVAERLGSMMDAVWTGYVVNFGEGGASFAQDLRDVQPTYFLGVPRVWEKMLASVETKAADASWLKRTVYRAAMREGRRLARKRMDGPLTGLDRARSGLGWVLLYRSLRHKLGLGRIHTALSGAAPIAPQVLEFFWALGVRVREGYGQTEDTAVCTITPADDVRIGAVGKALPGVELRIAPDGEILTRSPAVFAGYFKDPEASRAVVDPDGWLHTGDVGVLDEDGFLTITDRKKDIIITAGGKNIAPSEIENRLKVSPYVREAVVIGERRKYLVALIGIELDTVADWAARRGIPYTTYADLSGKPEVRELVGRWVGEVNADLASVEQIKRFGFLEKELDHEDGELTATQKVKRAALEREFGRVIDTLYGERPPAAAASPGPSPEVSAP
jgi:long-chain acyl-CoA synthetase